MESSFRILSVSLNITVITIVVFLSSISSAYSQWSVNALGIPATNNMYVVVPDGRGWVAVGGDGGWLFNSTSTGIHGTNTVYNPIKAIAYIDNTNGVAFAGTIRTYTVNGGDNWSATVDIELAGPGVNDVEFVSLTGYACGNSGVIRKYVSTGSVPVWTDWVNQTLNAAVTFSAVDVISTTQAYVVGNNGKMYRTTDGSNWANLTTGTTTDLRDISFKDASNGIAVGNNGTMLMTTDGGDNWTILPQYSVLDFHSVRYLSTGVIWIVGKSGLILKSLDNGSSWGTQNSGTTVDLNSICMLGSTAFVAGNSATLLNSVSNGGPITPVSPITSNLAEEKSSKVILYPNPSNGKFRANIDNKQFSENGQMEVSNTMGEIVFQNNTSKEVDLSEAPKGIYFVKIYEGELIYRSQIIIQ
jgi:photosystem II stability/assembly factor-like uncharacterized protein